MNDGSTLLREVDQRHREGPGGNERHVLGTSLWPRSATFARRRTPELAIPVPHSSPLCPATRQAPAGSPPSTADAPPQARCARRAEGPERGPVVARSASYAHRDAAADPPGGLPPERLPDRSRRPRHPARSACHADHGGTRPAAEPGWRRRRAPPPRRRRPDPGRPRPRWGGRAAGGHDGLALGPDPAHAAPAALRPADRHAGRSDRQHQADGPLPDGGRLLHPVRGGRVPAHHLLPRPADVMAVYTTRIEANREEAPVLLGNGNLVETGAVGEDRHYAVWHDPHPKPAYLFAIVGGRLGKVETAFRTMEGRDVTCAVYVEPGKEDRAGYALDAVIRSMEWDERAFGRAYDLDVFNVVAVSAFNMGAMENKGLNIFNDKYVLAVPETATDADYAAIEAIIAHEYFHNWNSPPTCAPGPSTGSARCARCAPGSSPRMPAPCAIPCGRTPMRRSTTSTRRPLRQGAEIVRMLRTLIGGTAFRAGMDRYFAENDGRAATVEDFLAAFAAVTGRDLSAFARWYERPGTPRLAASGTYDAAALTYTLRLAQHLPVEGPPLVIPVALGLVGREGPLAGATCPVGEGRGVRPRHARGDPGVRERLRGTGAVADAGLLGPGPPRPRPHRRGAPAAARPRQRSVQPLAGGAGCRDAADPRPDPTRPGPSRRRGRFAARRRRSRRDPSRPAGPACPSRPDSAPTPGADRRRPRPGGWGLLQPGRGLRRTPVAAQRRPRSHRGGRPGGRRHSRHKPPRRGQQHDRPARRPGHDRADPRRRPGGRPRCFRRALRERTPGPRQMVRHPGHHSRARDLARIERLKAHPAFSMTNPNRVRALIGSFSMANPTQFARTDGAGFALVAETVKALDSANPQVAARLLTAFGSWRRLEKNRRAVAAEMLNRIKAVPGLSRDVADILGRTLKDG
ncbi:hypothetical protein Lal_00046450 [Lupinus albus]|nr:hypothetical protein Lal_00046450 [Lupinus albus]